MTASKHRLRILLAPLLVLPLALVSVPSAHAAPLPDLRVTVLEADSSSVVVGAGLGVSESTKNVGRKKAGRSATRFYLSRDAAWSRSDLLLGKRRVPALSPGEISSRALELVVPDTVPARSYYLVACADGGNAVSESRESNNCRATQDKVQVTEAGGPAMFPQEPDPLSVDSSLEVDNAVTQTAFAFDLDGASTIIATATDGTTYTLEVPYRALLSAEDITMTPVATVPGLPLSGGLVAGVQIEPHGLMLQQPATLTIESPDAGTLANQTGFLFHEDGDDFHLYPMDPPEAGDDKDVVRMSLTHFSTPGVGLATSTDRQSVMNHPPARAQSQLEQKVSDLVSQERQSQLSNNPPNPGAMEQIASIHNAYYDGVLRARLQAAETNADLGPQAIAEGLGWSRARSLLGDEGNPRIAETKVRVEKILKNMMNTYWKRCTEDHDMAAVVWLSGLARQAALLGFSWMEEAQDKAERCANFEVRFDSRINGSHNAPGSTQSHQSSYDYRLKSTAEIPWIGVGEAPLTYAAFSYWYRVDYPAFENQCVGPNHWTETVGTTTTAGKLLGQVGVRANPREVAPGDPPLPPVVYLRVRPGQSMTGNGTPKESYHVEAHNCASSTNDDTDSRWLGKFNSLHSGEPLEFEIKGGKSEVVMTKAWNRTVPIFGGSESESTTLELWHKPLT